MIFSNINHDPSQNRQAQNIYTTPTITHKHTHTHSSYRTVLREILHLLSATDAEDIWLSCCSRDLVWNSCHGGTTVYWMSRKNMLVAIRKFQNLSSYRKMDLNTSEKCEPKPQDITSHPVG